MSSKLAIPAERKDRAAATVLPLPEPANPQQADNGSVQNSPVRKIRYDMQQHHDAVGGDEVLLDDAMKTPLKRPPSLPTPVSLVGAQLNFWMKWGPAPYMSDHNRCGSMAVAVWEHGDA